MSPLGFAAFILIAVVAGAIIGLVTRALLARLHDWRSTAASEIAPEASSIQESPVNFEEVVVDPAEQADGREIWDDSDSTFRM